MLTQINMEIEGQDLNYNMGSLFHGYLMSKIDTAFAEYFHYNSTRPYTSSVFKDYKTNKYFWRITTYNKKAYDMIMTSFIEDMPKEIYLEHRDMYVKVKNSEIKKDSFENLLINSNQVKRIRLLTPSSFKSQGVTHIFPNASTFLNGVISKINEHSETIKFEDEYIVEQILQNAYIKDYNLRTALFNLESIKIKGFIGSIDLSLKGDKTLLELLRFLIAVSEYTGFGIKTSLGMGAIKVE